MHDDAIARRFWAKVDQSGDCWVWTTGRFLDNGVPTYGMFSILTRAKYAHRVAWELTNGSIPNGLLVLHSCDNPPCVRPDHLYLGTNADNTRDAMVRRRLRYRERNNKTKLTEAAVAEIRRRWNGGEIARVLAVEFGVTRAAISQIVNGRNWEGVGPSTVRHGRPKQPHSLDLIQRVVADHRRGHDSAAALGRRYGVASPTVSRWIHDPRLS